MTITDWHSILDDNPGDFDTRTGFALWLVDEAPEERCELCQGIGFVSAFPNGRTDPTVGNPGRRCGVCGTRGKSALPNLLMAETQQWMVREEKYPFKYCHPAVGGTETEWEWWNIAHPAHDNKDAPTVSSSLLPTIWSAMPQHLAQSRPSKTRRTSETRHLAELALQLALVSLNYISVKVTQ